MRNKCTSLHETCQQYVARRLSEGWKVVGQYGHIVILSPPDGSFLRPVDLRNDVETLRPNAAGDTCSISAEHGVACPDHYQNVDEVSPDGNTTDVDGHDSLSSFEVDEYNLDDHTVSGTINKVTAYGRFMGEATINQTSASIGVKTGGSRYTSDFTITTSWDDYSKEFTTNPSTSAAWTWTEIDALQICVRLRSANSGAFNHSYCTQVYVEVDYTPAYKPGTRSANMAAKMVAAGLI